MSLVLKKQKVVRRKLDFIVEVLRIGCYGTDVVIYKKNW